MRFFFSITVAFVYLVLSAGLQLTTHYCHGQLESVNILTESKSCCCGSDEAMSSCCSNEVISIQADIDYHMSSENRMEIGHNNFISALLNSLTNVYAAPETRQNEFLDTGSPPIQKKPLWLLHSVFIFYG